MLLYILIVFLYYSLLRIKSFQPYLTKVAPSSRVIAFLYGAVPGFFGALISIPYLEANAKILQENLTSDVIFSYIIQQTFVSAVYAIIIYEVIYRYKSIKNRKMKKDMKNA